MTGTSGELPTAGSHAQVASSPGEQQRRQQQEQEGEEMNFEAPMSTEATGGPAEDVESEARQETPMIAAVSERERRPFAQEHAEEDRRLAGTNSITNSDSGRGDFRPPADGDDDDDPPECWICRDTTDEPLIQPCACRGSMSRVHASCVEQWIAHHRQVSVDNGPPKCGVCLQPYAGEDRLPAVTFQFVARVACKVVLLALLWSVRCADVSHGGNLCFPFRCTIIWLLLSRRLVRQSACAAGMLGLCWVIFPHDFKCDKTKLVCGVATILRHSPLREAIIALYWLAWLYKCVVLSVSRTRPAPHNFLRFFFEADKEQLAIHSSDVFSAQVWLVIFTSRGFEDIMSFLLTGAALLFAVIAGTTCIHRGVTQGARDLVIFALTLLFVPLLPVIGLIHVVRQNPRCMIHPLGAGWHVLVAAISPILALESDTNQYVIILWLAQALFVVFAFIEQMFIKRLRWNKGPAWWCMFIITFLIALSTTLFIEVHDGFGANLATEVLKAASFIWMALVAGLVFTTNRSSVVWAYRTWQRRHGQFTLDVSAEPENPNPAAVGLLAGEVQLAEP